MANGDVAVAAGLPVMNPSRDIRLGADDMNGILDAIVNWLGRQNGVPIPLSKGGTGGTDAPSARDGMKITRIDNSGHGLLMENDGRLHSDEIYGKTFDYAAPGDNRIMIVTPSGTFAALGKRLSNDYLPQNLYPDGDITLGGNLKVNGSSITSSGSKAAVQSAGALHINSDGKIGTAASARRFKCDIEEAGLDVGRLLAIEPKRFRLVDDPEGPEQLGFIAEDFEDVAPELVMRDDDGNVSGLHYERVTAALYAIVRSLNRDLAVAEDAVATLQEQAVLERKRTDQLERRTAWLYEQVTGEKPPAREETTA